MPVGTLDLVLGEGSWSPYTTGSELTVPTSPNPVNWKLMSSPRLHWSLVPSMFNSTLVGSIKIKQIIISGSLKTITTRQSSCVTARGIPPAPPRLFGPWLRPWPWPGPPPPGPWPGPGGPRTLTWALSGQGGGGPVDRQKYWKHKLRHTPYGGR